jgi:hypothetical protein
VFVGSGGGKKPKEWGMAEKGVFKRGSKSPPLRHDPDTANANFLCCRRRQYTSWELGLVATGSYVRFSFTSIVFLLGWCRVDLFKHFSISLGQGLPTHISSAPSCREVLYFKNQNMKNESLIASGLYGTWTFVTQTMTDIGYYKGRAYVIMHLMPDPMQVRSCQLKDCLEQSNQLCQRTSGRTLSTDSTTSLQMFQGEEVCVSTENSIVEWSDCK